ncbi:hypothetical protein Stsp02_03820 [Streptomyces sp. NBRC 14336]|nr:hypothetical protein Stsp02_03820 [Streptomyces sp. NBRC 14336]
MQGGDQGGGGGFGPVHVDVDGDRLVHRVGEPAGGGEHLVDGALSDAGDLPQPVGPRVEYGAHRAQSAVLDAAQPEPSLGDVLEAGHRDGVEPPAYLRVMERRQGRPYRLDGPVVIGDQGARRLVQPRPPGDNAPFLAPHGPSTPHSRSPHPPTGARVRVAGSMRSRSAARGGCATRCAATARSPRRG